MTYGVVIPTRNAGKQLTALLHALHMQETPPEDILVVDSGSEDATVQIAKADGARVIQIDAAQFDHGGTRNLAFRNVRGDVVVCLTQDALPIGADCIPHLLAPLADPRVAACGGRQIARTDARPYEKLVRQFSYPEVCRQWTREQIPQLGIRAYLISNVCAAYRRNAWDAVGGFDAPVPTNEDMLMAQKLLDAGWALAYCGDAQVWHSHSLSLRQEFRRNRLIGQTLERYARRLGPAPVTGEGVALARYVIHGLLAQRAYPECVCFAADCAARLAGNRIGKLQEKCSRKSAV